MENIEIVTTEDSFMDRYKITDQEGNSVEITGMTLRGYMDSVLSGRRKAEKFLIDLMNGGDVNVRQSQIDAANLLLNMPSHPSE